MTNLHIYGSSFRFESRILKETKSLIDLGLVKKIIIISTWEEGLMVKEQIDEYREVHRVKLFLNRFKKSKIIDLLKYLEFTIRVIFLYGRKEFHYINSHSLFVLPIAVALKLLKKDITLIYDTHELETEKTGLGNFAKKVSKVLEKLFIKFCDSVIVVCEPIAKWYENEYNISNVYVVRNVPYNPILKGEIFKSNILKQKFNIKYTDILFIYQGVVANTRGINELLEAFSVASPEKHIVFMGYGPMEKQINQYSEKYINIHFQEAVHPSEIIKYSSSADIGIQYIPVSWSLSYDYMLPNKFFEYLIAGLPVAFSDVTKLVASMIEKEECGWVIPSNNQELASFIEAINKDKLLSKIEIVEKYNKTIGWQLEAKKYQEIYTA